MDKYLLRQSRKQKREDINYQDQEWEKAADTPCQLRDSKDLNFIRPKFITWIYEEIYYAPVKKISIVKMLLLPKSIYTFNAMSVKTPVGSLTETDNWF